jgi:hypothetical protein
MLRIIQRFVKHCSCHLQFECEVVGHFGKLYIGQAVGGGLDLMVLIGGAEERATRGFEFAKNWHQVLILFNSEPTVK